MFDVGDRVQFNFSQYVTFAEGNTKRISGILTHTPGGPGDMFYIQLDNGKIVAVNPSSIVLVNIFLLEAKK